MINDITDKYLNENRADGSDDVHGAANDVMMNHLDLDQVVAKAIQDYKKESGARMDKAWEKELKKRVILMIKKSL